MHLETQTTLEPTRSSRKGKERDPSHRDLPQRDLQPTDLDEKLTALRRRTAGAQRIREKADRERTQQSSHSQNPNTPTPVSSNLNRTERSPRLAASPASRQSPSSPRKHASPQVIASRPSVEADHEDFSRRLKISASSPSPRLAHKGAVISKLFNPNSDPIPIRRTAEPEPMSDGTGSSYVHVPRNTSGVQPHPRDERGNGSRQLFDHRKDDPVRFSVLARPQNPGVLTRPFPTPKSSGDYISASSTSSYAASLSSSTFTLSSTTDGSSTSSALFEGRQGQGTEDSGNNVFSKQLKRLYRNITELETKVKQEDSMDDADDGMNGRVLLKGKEIPSTDLEKDKWKKQIADHKDLAETIHNLLEISLAPSVPASLRNIPTKYNIIVRLWTYAFHKLLESLRRASFGSAVALEHLQDFIYYAYTFYTGLLEEPTLNPFKSGWLEALGDLARYRMAVAAMVGGGMGGQGGLTTKAVSEVAAESAKSADVTAKDSLEVPAAPGAKSVSDAPAARIDDSPSPSVGIAAARSMEVEPEKERWRNIARDWYGAGLAEQPGAGKLHHHLGLLSREVESEELRGVYHFTKSMTTLHPFPTSRESILPIWSHGTQARRSLPDARASELFVLLHGMLFTNIQLDDFQPTVSRFIERLDIEGADEKEWIMMGIINISSIMEYGRPSGILRKLGGIGPKEAGGVQVAAAMRVMAKKAAAGVPRASNAEEDRMDVDNDHIRAISSDHVMRSPTLTAVESQPVQLSPSDTAELPNQPPALTCALQLTFSMLSHVLRRPTRKPSAFARSNINPYLTIILSFLATLSKQPAALQFLERSVPWEELTVFFATIPRKTMSSQGLLSYTKGQSTSPERWAMLTSGSAPPLAEDWCLRGMEWLGRKVFERGYWKSGEERNAELEVLEQNEGVELTDGRIEDDDGDDENGTGNKTSSTSDFVRRWVRICRCAVGLAGTIDGFTWVEGTREWKVEGKLAEKVKQWKEEDRLERLGEERRRIGRRWTDEPMDVDQDGSDAISEESEDGDDENDTEEINALKARRRYLKSLLTTAKNGTAPSTPPPPMHPRASKKLTQQRPALPIIPGYTILVVDTNILLSSLSMISSLVESMRWTVVIPLPVIMELDGLASNVSPQLGEAAQAAVDYVSSHIRTHALSLKVQTSKGNYLTSLSVRTEEVDFAGGANNADRSMDDLILKAAIWQDEHWVDRSSMLKHTPNSTETKTAVKVAFLSLDRNLRLKARARQLAAASEKDLAMILATTT